MDSKKMKIILAFSVAVNVALLVIMFALKSGYAEQAQASYKVATKAYTDQVAKTVNAQNEFIKKGNLVWQLTFEVTAQNLSKSAFDARIAALDEGKVLNPQTSGDVTTLSCGEKCKVSFTFKNGKFVSADYQELVALSPSATFKVEAPAPFSFKE